MRPGEHVRVRLADRLEIGIVLRQTTDGALVYVGERTLMGRADGAREPIVAEYLDCELMPTGRYSPALAQWICARLDALDVYHGVRRVLRRAG